MRFSRYQVIVVVVELTDCHKRTGIRLNWIMNGELLLQCSSNRWSSFFKNLLSSTLNFLITEYACLTFFAKEIHLTDNSLCEDLTRICEILFLFSRVKRTDWEANLVKYAGSDAASGWAGWALAHPEFGSSVNHITSRGQIMPTTLLVAHPDSKTQRHLWQGMH